MPKKALIYWDPQIKGYVMASSYNASFLEAFKTIVPAGAKHWDKDKKLWFFNEEWGAHVYNLCVTVFGKNGVDFKSKQDVEAQQTRQPQYDAIQPHSINGLGKVCFNFLSLLDYDEAKSLYRKALMRLHPDKGGSEEKTAQLNVAWKEIEKGVFHK